MSLSEPGPTPSTDIELVEAVRDALISTLILLCKDMTVEQVEALARAAVAAMPLSSREAVLREAGNRLSFAAQISGGTAGRDEGLVAAIEGWERALSDGGRDG